MDFIYLCRDIGLLKISRLQWQIFLGTLSMAFNCGLHAQPLPEVTVTGSFGGFSSFSPGTGLDFSSGAQPFSGYAQMMGLLRSIELAEDVRCIGKGFENTFSTALSPIPVANSLKMGNGIPQPHPVCRNS